MPMCASRPAAALLLDCRAYELVSARNAGGYDVESSLVAGQTPFGELPRRAGSDGEPRVLYGVHNGGIPGTGNPTNRGVDPYVATRGEDGWTTKYVGIPADGTPSHRALQLELSRRRLRPRDPRLRRSRNLLALLPRRQHAAIRSTRRRRPGAGDGGLDPASGGDSRPGSSAARSPRTGVTSSSARRRQFEADGNNNGDVSIYDRNLNTGDDARGVEDHRRRDDDRPRHRRARDLGRRIADRGRPAGLGIRAMPGTGTCT